VTARWVLFCGCDDFSLKNCKIKIGEKFFKKRKTRKTFQISLGIELSKLKTIFVIHKNILKQLWQKSYMKQLQQILTTAQNFSTHLKSSHT
jgi:hypothetical protein